MPCPKDVSKKFKETSKSGTGALVLGGTAFALGTSALAGSPLNCVGCGPESLAFPEEIFMTIVGSGILLDWLTQLIYYHTRELPAIDVKDDNSEKEGQQRCFVRLLPWIERIAQVGFFVAACMAVEALADQRNVYNLGTGEGTGNVVVLAGGFTTLAMPVGHGIFQKRCGAANPAEKLTVWDVALGTAVVAGLLFVLANLGLVIQQDAAPSANLPNGSSTMIPVTSNMPKPDAAMVDMGYAIFGAGAVAASAFFVAAIGAVVEFVNACKARPSVNMDDTPLIENAV